MTHFLENLSGMEADCEMVKQPDWPFATVDRLSRQQGRNIQGLIGTTDGRVSTDDAIWTVLNEMKTTIESKVQITQQTFIINQLSVEGWGKYCCRNSYKMWWIPSYSAIKKWGMSSPFFYFKNKI